MQQRQGLCRRWMRALHESVSVYKLRLDEAYFGSHLKLMPIGVFSQSQAYKQELLRGWWWFKVKRRRWQF